MLLPMGAARKNDDGLATKMYDKSKGSGLKSQLEKARAGKRTFFSIQPKT
jgi:hypothetical protein